jgi:pantetheine-phosphate adenylyltransferase
VSDFEFEFQMAMMNFHLNPGITSLFMMPDEKFIHLNSTVVKDVAKNGGDVTAFVPQSVREALFAKYST